VSGGRRPRGGRIALWLLRRAVAGTAPRRREWGEALLAEAAAVAATERGRFALGAARAIVRVRVRDAGPLPALAVLAAVALVVVADRTPSDDGGQLALLALLLGAGGAAFAHPRGWRLTGLLTGCAVAAAHAVALLGGAPLPYATHPPGWPGVVSLLVLCVPALGAAAAGAALGRSFAARGGQ